MRYDLSIRKSNPATLRSLRHHVPDLLIPWRSIRETLLKLTFVELFVAGTESDPSSLINNNNANRMEIAIRTERFGTRVGAADVCGLNEKFVYSVFCF